MVKEYLNLPVIIAYFIFFGAMFLSIYAYKIVPLSMGTILEATGYIWVMIFGVSIFMEKLNGCGETAANLYRHLGRYWQRGKTPDAFLPGYSASGGRGKYRVGRADARKDDASGFGKTLTPADLVNFEAAIRKHYLTNSEPDLASVYDRLLDDSYTILEKDEAGNETARLLPKGEIPSIRQFRYWYTRNRDLKEEAEKRKGETGFQLTGRAVTGKNDFGMMGPGSQYQVDATVADVYLVSQFNREDIIGRPVMYFVMDAESRIVTGMYIGLEGPSWLGMTMALYNAATDKVDYCHQFGIEITEDQWPCHHVPAVLLGDRGELESHNADRLVSMLGIRVDNAPPYRGDLKPIIESHFKTINTKVKPLLPGAVLPDDRQRGGKDYRLDAKLDIRQFTQIIIDCVLHYNNHHHLDGFEKSEQMLKSSVEAIPVKLWNWGIRNSSGSLRTDISQRDDPPGPYAKRIRQCNGEGHLFQETLLFLSGGQGGAVVRERQEERTLFG